jgi:hypothetical protein
VNLVAAAAAVFCCCGCCCCCSSLLLLLLQESQIHNTLATHLLQWHRAIIFCAMVVVSTTFLYHHRFLLETDDVVNHNHKKQNSPFFSESSFLLKGTMRQILFVRNHGIPRRYFNPAFFVSSQAFDIESNQSILIYFNMQEQIFVYRDQNYSFVTPSNQILCYVITNTAQYGLSISSHTRLDDILNRDEIQHRVCQAHFHEIARQRVWVRNNGLLSDGEPDHDSDSSYDDMDEQEDEEEDGIPEEEEE